MVEDIVTGLSRIKWLFVIARNSSFVYKGRFDLYLQALPYMSAISVEEAAVACISWAAFALALEPGFPAARRRTVDARARAGAMVVELRKRCEARSPRLVSRAFYLGGALVKSGRVGLHILVD